MNSFMKILTPVTQRRLEGTALLVAAIVMYGHWQFSWEVFAMYFFLPDLPILLYYKGPGIGGVAYNVAHSLLLPVLIGLFGVVVASNSTIAQQTALIWVSHIAFDRTLGWGLKYEDSFCNTDMGVKKLPISVPFLE